MFLIMAYKHTKYIINLMKLYLNTLFLGVLKDFLYNNISARLGKSTLPLRYAGGRLSLCLALRHPVGSAQATSCGLKNIYIMLLYKNITQGNSFY